MIVTVIDTFLRVLEAPLRVSSPLRPREAIVVLGAPLGRGDSLTPPLAERARAAAALYHAGGAPLVIATGGITRGAARAEADVLAEAIRAAGVADVLVERASLTTRDNARLTSQLTSARDVWLVTQPFHTRRAVRVFRQAGFTAHAWRIENSLEDVDRTRAGRWIVREYGAWALHLVRR